MAISWINLFTIDCKLGAQSLATFLFHPNYSKCMRDTKQIKCLTLI